MHSTHDLCVRENVSVTSGSFDVVNRLDDLFCYRQRIVIFEYYYRLYNHRNTHKQLSMTR
jgi:hypothetical protein